MEKRTPNNSSFLRGDGNSNGFSHRRIEEQEVSAANPDVPILDPLNIWLLAFSGYGVQAGVLGTSRVSIISPSREFSHFGTPTRYWKKMGMVHTCAQRLRSENILYLEDSIISKLNILYLEDSTISKSQCLSLFSTNKCDIPWPYIRAPSSILRDTIASTPMISSINSNSSRCQFFGHNNRVLSCISAPRWRAGSGVLFLQFVFHFSHRFHIGLANSTVNRWNISVKYGDFRKCHISSRILCLTLHKSVMHYHPKTYVYIYIYM